MYLNRATLITLTILGIIVLGVSLYALNTAFQIDRTESDITKSQPPDGTPYTDLSGSPVSLETYAGDVLVINAWASWCPFCVNELPDLNTLANEYRERGVTVLAINRNERRNTVQAYIDHIGNPEHITFLLDRSDHFYTSIGGFSMPETVFYDRTGNIVFHKRGVMKLTEMRQRLENILSASNK